MDPTALTQLGVAGVTVMILLYIIRELLKDRRDLLEDIKQLHEQNRLDQAQMLPALTTAAEAAKAALEESIRARALAERERQ